MTPSLPQWLLERLHQRQDYLGVLLYGSYALGQQDDGSDVDLLLIGRDAAPDEYWRGEDGLEVELHTVTLEQWRGLALQEHWQNFGLARGVPLVDPDGVVAEGLVRLQTPPPAYRHRAAEFFDRYCNATYRSVKAWRRGDALGARLHAGVALPALLEGLFRHVGEWTPYWDRLDGQWGLLEASGLEPAAVQRHLTDIARQPTDIAQIEFYGYVATWLREHGFGAVLDAWHAGFHAALQCPLAGEDGMPHP